MKRQLFEKAWMMLLAAILAIPLAAQTVTVQVDQAGGLWDALEAQGVTNFAGIKSLKVTGKMGTNDFLLIKNQMTNLESVDIAGTNVTEIPSNAFYEKEKLKTVRLPEDITKINDQAFCRCQNLEAITFGDQAIESGIISFPASLRYVGWEVFNYCSKFTHLDFTACTSWEGMSSSSFANLHNLTEVLFPDKGNFRLEWNCFNVDNIWDDATQQWVYKGLEKLTLTKAVTYLSGYSLPRTLKTLFVESANPPECDEKTFSQFLEGDNISLKVYVPKGSKRNYAIANGWSRIYQYIQEIGIQVAINGYGSVQYGKRIYTDGDVFFMQDNAVTLKAVPEMGCELISVELDGNVLTVNADGSFKIPAGTSIGTLNLTFTANPIVIDNPNGGELKDKIVLLGITPENLHTLKVTGKMNNKDWNFVKNNLPALEMFDISETDVTTIPESAFNRKQKLNTVHLSTTVTSISSSTFYDCPQLAIVDGCDNVQEIGGSAFYNCPLLSVFPFGKKIKKIESSAFCGCTSLPETLIMPASLNELGWSNVFSGSSIRNFDLSQCKLSGSFAYNAFGQCTSLLLPEKDEYSLQEQALLDAQLTALRLPVAVSSLWGGNVLPSMLQQLYVSRTEPVGVYTNTFDNIDFDNCTLYVPAGAADTYSETNTWMMFTNIREYGFKVRVNGYGSLQEGNNTYGNGDIIFATSGRTITLKAVPEPGCELLSVKLDDTDLSIGPDGSFTIPAGIILGTLNVTFTDNPIIVENPNGGELKDLIAAMGSNARTIRTLKVIGKMATKDWSYVRSSLPMLEEFDISETDVKTIPESALQDHQKLTIVHLPSSVITIGNSAFYNCPQLTKVDGCEHVKDIGSFAFCYCHQLANFPFGNEIRSIESDAFCECNSLPESLVMPASLNSWGWGSVFNGSSVILFDLSQCTINSDIAYNTFGKCTSLLLPEKGDYRLAYSAMSEAQFKELRMPVALSYIYGENVLPATLERLYVTRYTPVEVSNNKSFGKIDFDNCTLYVPVGSVEAYADAPYWSEFTNVKEYGMQVSIAEQGKVRVGTQTLQGTSTYFPIETAATFEIVPNAGWHADVVTLDGADIPFANNKFTLNGDQLAGKLAVTFAANQFNLQLQIAGSGLVKLGSLVYTANQTLPVDSLATLNFTLEPAAGQVVSGITFNGKESVVQNGGTSYVTPAITANSTLVITFGTGGAEGNVVTYAVKTGEGGSVEYKNTTLLPETTISVNKDVDAVFAIKPDDYYIIEKVLLDGRDVTDQVDANGQLTVKNVNADAVLQVIFVMNSHIIIALENGTRLNNALTDAQKQNVTKITVKGEMWSEDFYTMRDQMPNLAEIDLWEAQTDNIPSSAFCISSGWESSVGKTSLTRVRLPEATRWIGDFAFAGCSNLKEVNFAELKDLEHMNGRSFAWTALNTIDLSQTRLTSLSDDFYKVRGLENVRLPKTITYLGSVFRESDLTEIDLSLCTNLKTLDDTFEGSKKLVKVTLPEGLISINGYTFYNCEKLTTINLPKSLQTIGGWGAFQNTMIQKLDFSQHAELVSIGNNAFYSCKELKEVLLPESLQQIGNSAFYNCETLTSIDLSKTQLQNIPESAFGECRALESVKMPNTLETIDRWAFSGNYKLGGVLELPATTVSLSEGAFSGTQISIIKSEATTPPIISENAMNNDTWVTAFVPEGYADIYKKAPVWEDRAILDHEVHAEVTVSFEGNLANDIVEQTQMAPPSITHLKVHGPIGPKDFAIMNANMTLLYDLDMEDAECSIIPENAFVNKKVLMNVKLPKELLVIQENAFRGCSSLKGTLTLPKGVTTIGWAAFQGCSSLEKVELSDALEVIRGYAFEGCSSLQQKIQFPQYFTSIGEYAFANCRNLTGTVKFNDEFYMFMGNEGYWSDTGYTFENCSSIEAVDMSGCENLYQLPMGIFRGCTSLQTVQLPPYLERIEYNGFEDNTNLSDIEFPSSLMYIDGSAFRNCASLQHVDLSDCEDFATIGDYAFANCASLESVNLPASLNWINSYAFSECRQLEEFNVEALQPADLGDHVFYRVHTDRCVLSIPTGTYSDYLSAPQWGAFVQMRKAIDVSLDEGAALTYSSGGEIPSYAKRRAPATSGVRRAPAVESQKGNVNVKDGSSLYVAENENVTFYINPDENVSIKQVLFNDEDVTDQLQANAFVTPGLTENTSFKVLLNVDGPITVKELRMLDLTKNVRVAESAKLTATIYPTNATNKKVLWSSGDEKVATVAADGTVIGVAAGRTTITAKTEDGGFEQKCELVVMSNDYYITLAKEVNGFVDNTAQVPMSLHNAGDAQGIQFDVYLPEGLTMRNEWSEDYGIGLSSRSNGHRVTASRRSDGSVRVVVYSLDGKTFRKNDGELLSLPIGTRANVGDYDVEVKNIHVSGPNSFDFSAPDYKTRIHVADYPMGDSNGNGEVTVADATNTVDHILERYTERFIEKAADVNTDGVITVSDVTAAIDIVLERPASSPMRKVARISAEPSADNVYIDNVSMANGQQQTIDLKLTNKDQYIAFQCDIMLPEGLTAATNEKQVPMVNVCGADAQTHVVQADYIGSGALRLIVMSMSNSAFAADDNNVVSLTVEANSNVLGQKDIDIQNVRLVSVADHTESVVPDTRATINIVDPATGFNSIASGKNLQVTVDGREIVVISDTGAVINLVHMNGTQRILKVNVGENRFHVDQPGVYVIQGQKIMIK